MSSKNWRLFSLFILYASLSTPAYAYLDPATGSIVLQALIGAVGTALVYYRLGMAKIRAGVSRVFGRKSGAQDKQ